LRLVKLNVLAGLADSTVLNEPSKCISPPLAVHLHLSQREYNEISAHASLKHTTVSKKHDSAGFYKQVCAVSRTGEQQIYEMY